MDSTSDLEDLLKHQAQEGERETLRVSDKNRNLNSTSAQPDYTPLHVMLNTVSRVLFLFPFMLHGAGNYCATRKARSGLTSEFVVCIYRNGGSCYQVRARHRRGRKLISSGIQEHQQWKIQSVWNGGLSKQ